MSSGRLFIVLPPDKLGVDLAKTSAREKRQMGGFAMSHHGAFRVGFAALAGASMLALTASMAAAQYKMTVNRDRLVNAQNEPQNWLMMNGDYGSQRYSKLTQINRDNVKNLRMVWAL